MKVIAKLIDMMHDELEGADEYAMCALKYKSEHPKLAQRLNELAGVELQHLKILHGEVERLIEDPLAEELLKGAFDGAQAVRSEVEGDRIIFCPEYDN